MAATQAPSTAETPGDDTMEPAGSAAESRGARRKRRTRQKLTRAALQLMGERGMAAVAINEITELADVGIGSFYNHFESKEALFAALVDDLFEGFADALDHVADTVDDPAEVVAASIRYTLARATGDPAWGRFLVQVGLSAKMLDRGLSQRLVRDIGIGIARGRFQVDDVPATFLAIGGTVLATLGFQMEYAPRDDAEAPQFGDVAFPTRDLSERTVVLVLRFLGLDKDDARDVAARPLPPIEFPDDNP